MRYSVEFSLKHNKLTVKLLMFFKSFFEDGGNKCSKIRMILPIKKSNESKICEVIREALGGTKDVSALLRNGSL